MYSLFTDKRSLLPLPFFFFFLTLRTGHLTLLLNQLFPHKIILAKDLRTKSFLEMPYRPPLRQWAVFGGDFFLLKVIQNLPFYFQMCARSIRSMAF